MTTPTLENGDIWSEDLANASIRPVLDGQDLPGHGAKVPNEWLDDSPGHIKSDFYSYYNRIKVSVLSGLTVQYTGATIRRANGTTVYKNPGNLFLPNNSNVFIYAYETGGNVEITSSPVLPNSCLPLAYAQTSGGEIVSIEDIRQQTVEEIRPISIPSQATPFLPGDIKATTRSTLEPGFVWADGSLLSVVEYIFLFNAIGYTYGGAGSQFRVPDLRGRTIIGAGQGAGLSPRTLGQYIGAETHQLSTAEMPSHGHAVTDGTHSHPVIDGTHTHTTTQTPHTHPVNDPQHSHFARNHRSAALNASDNDGAGAELSTQGTGPLMLTERSSTGITISPNSIAISVNAASSNVAIGAASSNISIASAGGNAAHNNMQPSLCVNYMIKA